MAGQLAPVRLTGIQFENIDIGSLTVDIAWSGQANAVDAHQLRTRWIAHGNGVSTPPPDMAVAGAWAESTTFNKNPAPNGSDFWYIDTIETLTAAQMAVGTSDAITEDNEAVTQGDFADKTVWAMSRLEIE